MTVRTDVTVDYDVSPRIITVLSPSTEITVQDLHDTVTGFEDSLEGAQHPNLISSAGKEALGGGTLVGITTTLQNARVAFEARGGPTYVQCNISGGNLVAVDGNGDPMSQIEPTAFTQIILANSSSATLQEQADIQYASFAGGIWYDVASGFNGEVYPVGTQRQPVDNFTDGLAIANTRGFNTFFTLSDATIDAGLNYDNTVFIGQGQNLTVLTVTAAASVLNCTFRDAEITGTLDGDSHIEGCTINSLNYINGVIEECLLEAATITLGGGADAHFVNCASGVPGASTPTIDMGGSGQALAMRNYNGGITLTNKSGSEPVSLDLNSGQVILQNSVTNGTVIARGVGKLIDAAGDPIRSGVWNSNVTIVNELTNPDTMTNAIWNYTGP